jgi:2-dehydropantoate 2-reductase
VTHLVVGAGAVGIGLATALLAAGERVVFLARSETADALRSRGCGRVGIFGDVSFPPHAFSVVEAPAELRGNPTTVLVATKSFASRDVAGALAQSAQIAESDAPIVLAQNGLGNAEVFCERFAERRVWNACVITGFRRLAPQRVEVTVHAEPILLGSLFSEDPEPLAALAQAITRGGIPVKTAAAIGPALWAKALYNCALNPLGAILGVPYGELARSDATRRLMDGVVREIFAVMRACGVTTHWPDADAYRSHFYEVLLPPTAEHESSMLQDVRARRRTEIDALCGEVATRGSRVGVATPVNEALAQLIRALEPYAGAPGGR